jgi:hypothetical protein
MELATGSDDTQSYPVIHGNPTKNVPRRNIARLNMRNISVGISPVTELYSVWS